MKELIKTVDEIIRILKGNGIFNDIIDDLNGAFMNEWDGIRKQVLEQLIDKFINYEGNPSDAEIAPIIATVDRMLGTGFAEKVRLQLSELQTKTYSYALGDNKKLKIETSFNQTSIDVMNWLEQNHSYWLGNFYSSQIKEQFDRDLNGLFTDITIAGYGREKAGSYLKDKLNGLFETPEGYKGTIDNYFQGVATNFITQTREFAHIDQYERAGIEYVTVIAVLDHRTSKICRHLNGVVIPVAHLKKQRDKIMAAKNPEKAKEFSWWPKDREVEGIDVLSLPKNIGLPPYHFFCRSTTRVSTQAEIKEYLAMAA